MKDLGLSEPLLIPPLEGYRLWSRTYDTDPNPILALESRILTPRLRGLAGKSFIDVGCGTGRWMSYAAENRAAAFGADFCPEMLRIAAGKSQSIRGLTLADAHALPFRSGFADIVICSFTISYLRDPGLAVREMVRIAKPGGSVFVTDLHPQARARGWRRTFRNADRVYELETLPISSEMLLRCGLDSGLQLREFSEPHLGIPEFDIMRGAGKGDAFDEVSSTPAILCVEWKRA